MIMLPSLTRRGQAISPFDALWDMRREIDRMFSGSTELATQAWAMPAEVVETDNEIRFVVEAPGLRPEDLDVTVENNVLTVSGEKKVEHDEGEKGEYHLYERRYGRFERSFALPRRVDTEHVDANYENGVLTVTLRKSESAKPRRIKVDNGARQIGKEPTK
jgi:HSP20 family protein